MKKIMLSLLLVLVVSTWAAAESSVWKAQKNNSVLYLGGTFHILRESDFPLPPEFDQAYRASQTVVFETDIGKFQDLATQQKILAKASYTDGSTIENHLSAKVYADLKAFCEANAIPLEAFSQLKPSLLMTTLTLLELMKFGVSQQGVDLFYYQRAVQDHKAVRGLESIDEHMNYLVTMADGDEDDFVLFSLKDMKELEANFESMTTAWRKGDVGKLDQTLVSDLKRQQPNLYRKLITDRNRKWLPLIDAREKNPKTRFILVGAAHLVGPDGLIESLRKRGYTVTKL